MSLPTTVMRYATALSLLLAGCGFQPVYRGGTGGPVAAQLAEVEIGLVPDRLGQMLRNELIDRMYRAGRPGRPSHRLELQVTSSELRLGYQKDATATRGQIRVTARYMLYDAGGRLVLTGQDQSIAGYSIVMDQYAILVNEREAYDRASEQLADGIVRQLALHFRA